MTIYFPCSPSVPEEIFFEILKFVHPGAIWLFCRRVSRAWKGHVDVNIERFYKFHVGVVKFERERVGKICESGEPSGHLVQRLQADSLYVEIQWTDINGDEARNSESSVVLRFKEIELPAPDRTRDLRVQWDDRITFEPESKDIAVYGDALSFIRIEHFMFPGFAPAHPAKHQPRYWLDFRKLGTHNLQFDDYLITYTLHYISNVFHSTRGLTINQVSVPIRSLLRFQTPHIVSTEISASGSHVKLRCMSPLFSTVDEERELLPENVLARRQKEEYEKWRDGMKPLCGICEINPLDKWCENYRCEVCCRREIVCFAHLDKRRGKREMKIRKQEGMSEVEFVGAVEDMGSWGEAEGQESWGRGSRDVSEETLVEEGGTHDVLGEEAMWLLKGYDVSTPPLFDLFDERDNTPANASNDDIAVDTLTRPQSASSITECQWSRESKVRPVSCSF